MRECGFNFPHCMALVLALVPLLLLLLLVVVVVIAAVVLSVVLGVCVKHDIGAPSSLLLLAIPCADENAGGGAAAATGGGAAGASAVSVTVTGAGAANAGAVAGAGADDSVSDSVRFPVGMYLRRPQRVPHLVVTALRRARRVGRNLASLLPPCSPPTPASA